VEDDAEFVAECLWPGVTEADLAELDARVRATETEGVRYLGSLLVPVDEVVFCFFQGPSAQAIESVAGRARIPFERILESVRAPGPTGRGD
jgi:hypothetical protein